MKKIFPILLTMILSSACGRERLAMSILSDAEQIMTETPDSALTLVEGIDKDALRTDKAKARYALLYSIALDKNYIDVVDDSLIQIAVNYYETGHDDVSKMKAYYYLGRVQHNAVDYVGALISYDKAEKYAIDNRNYLYAGLICRYKANIYNSVYNHHEELECAKESYEYFEKFVVGKYLDYAILDLGIAYNNNGDYEKAKSLYQRAMDVANAKNDTLLLANSIVHYASLLSYYGRDEAIKAIGLYRMALEELEWNFSVAEYAKLSDAYAKLQKKDSSDLYLELARLEASNSVDSIRVLSTEYRINKLYGNWNYALDRLEAATQM